MNGWCEEGRKANEGSVVGFQADRNEKGNLFLSSWLNSGAVCRSALLLILPSCDPSIPTKNQGCTELSLPLRPLTSSLPLKPCAAPARNCGAAPSLPPSCP